VVPWRELRTLAPAELARRVHDRIGSGPVFLSFDVDFVDPAFAPGTGTPEIGGPSSSDALELLRALDRLDLVAADCVEVAPAYDHGAITAMLAVGVCHTILCLLARARKP
jgi:agmatinase